nr:putative reverse transcriptase domain-containing protein [Tanacetum cinerariifolium]
MIAGIKVEKEIIRNLERFDIERKANVVADALSRKSGMIASIKVEFRIDEDNALWRDTRLVVPNDALLREALLTEAHSSLFSVHPGKANVVADALSRNLGMVAGIKVEEEIIRDLERLDIELYHVKIEHQWAGGLLQQLDIPVWKWDEISMDFVTGLPLTQRRHDAIWVVVDRLTKSAHFIPIRKDFSVSRLAEIFQQEIV